MRVFIPCVLIMVSCTVSSVNEKKIIHTIRLLDNFNQHVLLSDLITMDSIKIIDPGSYHQFGEIQQFVMADKRLILHTSSPSSVTVLNQACEIEVQLVPDYEIKEITAIDVFNDQVYVLDRSSFTIFKLSYSLTVMEKFKIPVFAQSFKILDPEKVALYTGNEVTEHNSGKLILYNYSDKKITGDYISISEKQRKYFNFFTTYHFPVFDGRLMFWDSSMNEFFEIDRGMPEAIVKLDYGKDGLPPGFYGTASFENPAEFLFTLRKQHYAFRHFRVMANDNFLLITFEKRGDFLTCIYNKETGHLLTFSEINDDILTNKNLSEIELSFFATLLDEDSFVALLPNEIIEGMEFSNPVLREAALSKYNVLIFGKIK